MAPGNKTILTFLRRDVSLPNHPTRGDFRREFQGADPLFADRANIEKLVQESTERDVSLDNDPELVPAGEPEFLIGNSGVTVDQQTASFTDSVIQSQIGYGSAIQFKQFSGSDPLDGPFLGELPQLLPLPDATRSYKTGKGRQDGSGFIKASDETLRERYIQFLDLNIAPDTATFQSVSIVERTPLTHYQAKQLVDGTFIDHNDYLGIIVRPNYTLITDVDQLLQIQLFLLYRRNGPVDSPQDRNKFGLLEIRDYAVWNTSNAAVAVVEAGRVEAAGAGISSFADITATYEGLTTDPIRIFVET